MTVFDETAEQLQSMSRSKMIFSYRNGELVMLYISVGIIILVSILLVKLYRCELLGVAIVVCTPVKLA